MIIPERCKHLTLEALLEEEVDVVGTFKENTSLMGVLERNLKKVNSFEKVAGIGEYLWVTADSHYDPNSLRIGGAEGGPYLTVKENKGGGFAWKAVSLDDRFNENVLYQGRGKLSKLLSKVLTLSEVDVARVQTAVNTKDKGYTVVISDNVYSHYRRLKAAGHCQSCMSYAKDYYSIQMPWGDESPLIAYEADPDWGLALVRDDSLKDCYPYIGRALYHRPTNSIVRCYGQSLTAAAFSAVGINVRDSWEEGSTLVRILDNRGHAILPYLDGDIEYCKESGDGTFWIISVGGYHRGNHETGITEEEVPGGVDCSYCHDRVDEDDIYGTDFEGDNFCCSCYENGDVVWVTGSEREYYPVNCDSIVYVESECNYYLMDETVWVDGIDEYVLEADAVWSDHHGQCFRLVDAVEVEGDWYHKEDEGELWVSSKNHGLVLLEGV